MKDHTVALQLIILAWHGSGKAHRHAGEIFSDGLHMISDLLLFLANGLHHAGQAGLDDAAGHGQIQADVPGGVAHEQTVAALQQHARLVGEEVRQVGGLRQALAQAGIIPGVTHSCS